MYEKIVQLDRLTPCDICYILVHTHMQSVPNARICGLSLSPSPIQHCWCRETWRLCSCWTGIPEHNICTGAVHETNRKQALYSLKKGVTVTPKGVSFHWFLIGCNYLGLLQHLKGCYTCVYWSTPGGVTLDPLHACISIFKMVLRRNCYFWRSNKNTLCITRAQCRNEKHEHTSYTSVCSESLSIFTKMTSN